jgi:hypothetical protein
MLAKLAFFPVAPQMLTRLKGRCALRCRSALDPCICSADWVNRGESKKLLSPVFQLPEENCPENDREGL